MMVTIKCIAGLAVLALLSGCSSPSSFGDYLGDRGRDFSDMWVVGVGYGYGLHVRASVPLPVGFGTSHTREVGWDGRDGVRLSSWYRNSSSACLLPLGFMDIDMVSSEEVAYWNRDAVSWWDIADGNAPADMVYAGHAIVITGHSEENTWLTSKDNPIRIPFGLEATVGVVSARFQVDPFQAIDFILGFLLIDLYRDDDIVGRLGPIRVEGDGDEDD
jgi:hypothetical protein